MTKERAKSELMQLYGSLSEEKKQALDVLMAQADGKYITQSAGDEIRQKNYDLISRQAVLDLCDKSTKYDIPYEYYEGKKYIRGWDEGRIINMTKLKLLPGLAIPTSPCDLCRYNPPSSGNGKPCTMCPAQERSEDR